MRKNLWLLVALGCLRLTAAAPETVMVTLHARAGAENELARVIASHWSTAHELNLVEEMPHTSLRGTEAEGKTFFVEVFTWRDAAIPDQAPPPIRSLWDAMNRLVEPRGGHPGLEFTNVILQTDVPDLGAAWAADWSAKRLDHIMSLYAPDGVFYTTEGGRFEGRTAIEDLFREALSVNDPTIHMRKTKSDHSGELGFESGEFEETLVSAGKKRNLTGQYLIVVRKSGNQWLIAEQMWSDSTTQK